MAGHLVTAAWQAARNGLPGDGNATDASAQINQFLESHGLTACHRSGIPTNGSQLLTPSTGKLITQSWIPLSTTDYAVLIGDYNNGSFTTQGRVMAAIQAVGAGADLEISIASDNGGVPGTIEQTTYVPREVINALTTQDGSLSGLAIAPNHAIIPSLPAPSASWGLPSTASGGAQIYASQASSGNYMVWAGGVDSGTHNGIAAVNVIPWLGGGKIGQPQPQSTLPLALAFGGLVATDNYLIYIAGATISALSVSAVSQFVYTAAWSPQTGTIGTWYQQANLPIGGYGVSAAYDPASSTVYAIGGGNNALLHASVYIGHISNGQITSWSASYLLPEALCFTQAAVINGYLVVNGGSNGTSGTIGNLPVVSGTYYAKINADGTLDAWQTGPVGQATDGPYYVALESGLVTIGSQESNGAGFNDMISSITFGPDGPGDAFSWENSDGYDWTGLPGVFYNGDGTWDLIFINSPSGGYWPLKLTWTPFVSAPRIPLLNNTSYYLILHQVGGTASDYLRVGVQASSSGTTTISSPRGANTWTADSTQQLLVGWDSDIYRTPYTYNGFSMDFVNGSTPDYGPRHLMADSSKRITTLLWDSVTGATLLGLAESTQQADGTWLTSVTKCSYDAATGLLIAATLQ